mgnify:CR=1 FL=1
MKKLLPALFLGIVVSASGCIDPGPTPGGKKYIDVNGSETCWSYSDYDPLLFEEKEEKTVCFTPEQIVIDPDEDQKLEKHDFNVYGTYQVEVR